MTRVRFRCLLKLALLAALGSDALAAEAEREGIRWGALPVSNYSTDRGLTLGAMGQRFDYGAAGREPFENLLTLQFTSSSRGATAAFASYETTRLNDAGLRGLALFSYSLNDFQPYYGTGDSTAHDVALDRADHYQYSLRELTAELAARKKGGLIEPQLGAAFTARSSRPSAAGSRYESEFGASPLDSSFVRIFAAAILERRDSELIPSRGYFASAELSHTPAALSGAAAWSRLDLDYRRYDSILSERRLWLATQARYASTSGSAPIPDKARLGSLGTLRGLPFNRYLSDHSLSLRTEARSVLFREQLFSLPLKAGAGVFVDAGKIGDSLARLASTPMHWGWGLTFFGSYFTDDFLGAADIGFSEGSTAVYFRLGHAF